MLGGCASGGDAPSLSTSISPESSLPSGASRGGPMFPESKWGVSTSPRVAWSNSRIPKGGGVYKVGTPYQVGGKWYDPREQPDYDRVGIASWYGADFHGRKTSNGEVYDMNRLSAAHPTLPLPCYAYVPNVANGRTILVRINDRGPYVAGRVIDLSRASAHSLGVIGRGTGRVRVRYAGRAPMDGDDSREREFLASREWSGNTRVAAAAPDYQPSERPSYPPRRWSEADATSSAPMSYPAEPVSYTPPADPDRPTWTPSSPYPQRSYAGAWSPIAYRSQSAAR